MKNLFILVFFLSQYVHSQICEQRQSLTPLQLQEPKLNESSGLAFSKRYSDRIYHINDSGSVPEFFISNHDGQNVRTLPIRMGFLLDTEDISVGPCLGEASCLVIGDIGDNWHFRSSIQFYFFKESNLSDKNLQQLIQNGYEVPPDLVLSVSYPDCAHNAEAFFLDSLGNLSIITKEKKGTTAQLFALPANEIVVPPMDQAPSMAVQPKFKRVMKIDFKKLLPRSLVPINTEITGAAYNEKSQTVAILTYDGFFEVLASRLQNALPTSWQTQVDYVFTPVRAGSQQEGIAYIPGTSDVMISSEMGNSGLTPLLRSSCQK